MSKILDNVLNDAAANETIEKLKEDTKLLNQCLMKKKRNLLLFSLSYFLKNQEKRTNLFLKKIMRRKHVLLNIASNGVTYIGGEIVFKNMIIQQQSIIGFNISSIDGSNTNNKNRFLDEGLITLTN